MRAITLGLGIIIGQQFAKYIYVFIAHLFVGPVVNKTYQIVMFSSELCIPIGIYLSALLLRHHKIIQRLPDPIPGNKFLQVGVCLFFITWAVSLISRLIPIVGYALASFPPLALTIGNQALTYFAVNMLIYCGLFLSLLSAEPIVGILKHEAKNDS